MSHDETVTYLEMTAPDDLRPAAAAPGVVLDETPDDPDLIRTLHERVGAPHHWKSAVRSDESWAAYFAHPFRRYWVVRHHGEPAGVVDLTPHDGGETEIQSFGLVPEFVGRGLGGFALTLAVRRAWALPPVGAGAVTRVWLHTSTLDHPNALPNYRRRGFRPYRTIHRVRDDLPT